MTDHHLRHSGPPGDSPSEVMPSALRDTVLSMVTEPGDRMALELLGRMVFGFALQCPAPPETDRSLRPTLRAAAKDLHFVAETLSLGSPLGSSCDVTLAAIGERAAGTLRQLAESLEQATTPSASSEC